VKPVFADTFYWIALTSPAEAAYERANQVTDDIVTIDEVLTEYLTFFSSASAYVRRKTANNVHKILRDSGVQVIAQTRESFLRGLDPYASRPDKGYSLTDCISMQTMRCEGLIDVLTNDRHFEQEGFRALFRDS
jgi:predicted nucleic acid-binding protein